MLVGDGRPKQMLFGRNLVLRERVKEQSAFKDLSSKSSGPAGRSGGDVRKAGDNQTDEKRPLFNVDLT